MQFEICSIPLRVPLETESLRKTLLQKTSAEQPRAKLAQHQSPRGGHLSKRHARLRTLGLTDKWHFLTKIAWKETGML